MKHFIYTRSERWIRSQNTTEYTVRLYQIIRGVPKFIGDDTDTYCSDYQQVMATMQKYKVLPKKWFVKGEYCSMKYSLPELRALGIATVTGVS